jgi:hypothetical protein
VKIAPKRVIGFGAAVSAGTMAEERELSVAPMPRSIIRRDSFISR